MGDQQQPIVLGQEYKDSLTGFTGIAVSRTEYLYGCVHIGLECKDGNVLKAYAFDEQRIVSVDDKELAGTATSGGPAPSRD